jgi:rod shape-determining protein MreB and related proteins
MLSPLTSVFYVQISPDRIVVRNVKTGEFLSEVPEVAIEHNPKSKLVGVGNEVKAFSGRSGVLVFNPFTHPRMLVSDFTVAEQILKTMIRRMKRSFFAASPVIIMHPIGNPLGGYTQVEIRVFRELAIGAGASEVIVWRGRSLLDQEVLAREFPRDGEVLF